MFTTTAKWVVVLSFFIVLAGCASTPEEPTSAEVVRNLHQQEGPGRIYTYGQGETQQQARRQALAGLAEQVQVQITSRTTHHVSLQYDGAGSSSNSNEQYSSTVNSYAQLYLQESVNSTTRPTQSGWVVQLAVSSLRMKDIQERVSRQKPLLAYVSAIEDDSDAGVVDRMRWARQGLRVAEREGLLEDFLYTQEGEWITFELYFRQMLGDLQSRIQVLPVTIGDHRQVRPTTPIEIILIDRKTMAPQDGVRLKVNGRTITTDTQGRTPRRTWEQWTDSGDHTLQVRMASESYWTLGSFMAAELTGEPTAIYLHTQPKGAVVELMGQTYTTPFVTHLRPGNYPIAINAPDGYRSMDGVIEVTPTAAMYKSVTLQSM